MKLESRKQVELQNYEQIYSNGYDFSNPKIREGLLADSESSFIEQMQIHVRGKKVLEIGCGRGRHSLLASQFGALLVMGIDISPAAVQTALSNKLILTSGQNVDFKQMDCENLEFPDGFFDIIIDHESLSSLDLDTTVKELHRVLMPGGLILGIECLGHNPIFNLNRRLKKLLGKRTAWTANNMLTTAGLVRNSHYFSVQLFKPYALVAILCWPLILLTNSKRLRQCALSFDRYIFTVFPNLARFAFKAVFILKKV